MEDAPTCQFVLCKRRPGEEEVGRKKLKLRRVPVADRPPVERAPVMMFPSSPEKSTKGADEGVGSGELIMPKLPVWLASIAKVKTQAAIPEENNPGDEPRRRRTIYMTKEHKERIRQAALALEREHDQDREDTLNYTIQAEVLPTDAPYHQLRESYRKSLRQHLKDVLRVPHSKALRAAVKQHIRAGTIVPNPDKPYVGPGALSSWKPPSLPTCLRGLVDPEFRFTMSTLDAPSCPLCSSSPGSSPGYSSSASPVYTPVSSMGSCTSMSTTLSDTSTPFAASKSSLSSTFEDSP
ncbi:hypothetical protein DIPPA_08629 [Diplonema papillatum]|nr:hypothetical protein DIPPA_08629 [Diplonema papillatum]